MSGPRRFLIEERFHITGRGTVVVIGETTELPVGRTLHVARRAPLFRKECGRSNPLTGRTASVNV